eukprot:TRINITY_DN21512_c0_g1_i1.p1 TRINITY_DN21512_c0_g1~~TRINITY_DN21512_c0_g1_i1.p1  ORF type:complete len:479 (-),score=38.90 TRINITY_DN21512_c0_g1_i1:5-1441(-)
MQTSSQTRMRTLLLVVIVCSLLRSAVPSNNESAWVQLLRDASYSARSRSWYQPLRSGEFVAIKAVYRSGGITCGGVENECKWTMCDPHPCKFTFDLMVGSVLLLKSPSSTSLPPQCRKPATPSGDIVCNVHVVVKPQDQLSPTWFGTTRGGVGNVGGAVRIDLYGLIPPPAGVANPDAPLIVQTMAGDRSVSLMWSPPSSDGGAPIRSYEIQCDDGVESGMARITAQAQSDTVPTAGTVTGLVNGRTFDCTVTASNDWMSSETSAAVRVVPVGAPSPPTDIRAAPGSTDVLLRWTAPATTGGAPLTSYIVESEPATAAGVVEVHAPQAGLSSTAPTKARVDGLSVDEIYTFRVRAVNSAGKRSALSDASSPVRVLGPVASNSSVLILAVSLSSIGVLVLAGAGFYWYRHRRELVDNARQQLRAEFDAANERQRASMRAEIQELQALYARALPQNASGEISDAGLDDAHEADPNDAPEN